MLTYAEISLKVKDGQNYLFFLKTEANLIYHDVNLDTFKSNDC